MNPIFSVIKGFILVFLLPLLLVAQVTIEIDPIEPPKDGKGINIPDPEGGKKEAPPIKKETNFVRLIQFSIQNDL